MYMCDQYVPMTYTDAQIGFELSAYTVEEEDEAVQICVSINQPFSGTVTATVSTIGQSAQGKSLCTLRAGCKLLPCSLLGHCYYFH